MTVFAKDTVYGLEDKIKELQSFLNTRLPSYWSGTLNIYGLFKQKLRDGNIVPEVYKGAGIKNKEYTEAFIDDKVAGTIGFIVQDRDIEFVRFVNIDCVFTLQIDRIYPTSITRDIEKAYLEAEKTLLKFGAINSILDFKEGIADVFSGFYTDSIKHNDMHPWCVFSLNFDLPYSDNTCQ